MKYTVGFGSTHLPALDNMLQKRLGEEITLYNEVYDKYRVKHGNSGLDIASRQVKPCKPEQLEGIAAKVYLEMFQIYKTQGHKDRLSPFEKVCHRVDGKENSWQVYLVPRLCMQIINGAGQEMRMYARFARVTESLRRDHCGPGGDDPKSAGHTARKS